MANPNNAADDRLERESFSSLLRGGEPSLTDEQLSQLWHYRNALFERNKTTNLTAIRDLPGIERRLLLESLRLVAPLRAVTEEPSGKVSVLDIGTGGGLPGLVLAIAIPTFDVTLLDATGKKIAFLQQVIAEIGTRNVRTIHGRAEHIARDPAVRGSYSAVVARAVSSLPALVELGLPMLRIGGHLLLPKGRAIDEELENGRAAASILGGEIVEASLLPSVGSEIETRLVTVRKTAPTPGTYPRRSGIPSRDPLGSGSRNDRSGTASRGGNRPKH